MAIIKFSIWTHTLNLKEYKSQNQARLPSQIHFILTDWKERSSRRLRSGTNFVELLYIQADIHQEQRLNTLQMHSAWNAWVFLGETTYPKHNTYESRNSMFTLFKQRRLGFCIISCAWIAVAFQKDIRREELLQWPSKKRRLPVWYQDSLAWTQTPGKLLTRADTHGDRESRGAPTL